MDHNRRQPPSPPDSARADDLLRRRWSAVALLVIAPVLVYLNALDAPFVLDDGPVVRENPSIRSLWPITVPLSPPEGGLPVCGRPLANLSFAVNHAVAGETVWSYHAFNLALHVCAALALWALLRRILAHAAVPARIRTGAEPLALAVAALWALHPLQTAAVTYVSQRTELLAGLCLLLMLLALSRAAEDRPGRRRWAVLAVLSCLAGMASKEVVAAAPVLALLYDRAFLAGGFAAAWRRRWPLHLALMSTWLLLGWLVLDAQSRGGTAGLDVGMSPVAYAATQAEAIVRYLALAVWPHPLVFDYGDHLTRSSTMVIGGGLAVAGLGGLTLWALARRPVAGFAGAVFFGVLAPSSSVVPVATQTIAEHRMYLPLGCVLALLGAGLYAWLGRRALLVLLVAAVVAGGLTARRNQDYGSVERLWRDTVQKRPENVRARNNLAAALLEQGKTAAGLAELEAAQQLRPDDPAVLRNVAQAQLNAGHGDAALAAAEQAQQLDPSSATGWRLLGEARLRAGDTRAAVAAFREAIRRRPDLAGAHAGLGAALAEAGELSGAIEAYAEARRLRPDSADVVFRLADVLLRADREREAVAAYEEGLRLEPNHAGAEFGYGNALLQAGRADAALAQFERALQREGPSAPLLCSRALALLELDRGNEARAEVRAALTLEPEYGPALQLARALGAVE